MDLKNIGKFYQGFLILPYRFFNAISCKSSAKEVFFFCPIQFVACSTSLLLGYDCEIAM